jgi:hypothetical protein
MKRVVALIFFVAFASTASASEKWNVDLKPANTDQWKIVEGKWSVQDGSITQEDTSKLTTALLAAPAFADFELSTEFNIRPTGSGVRAAAVVFRATGTRTFYWLHLDSKNGNAILTRSSPENEWIEMMRRPVKITQDAWHKLQVDCRGPEIHVVLDGQSILEAKDMSLAAGRIGLGTSEGAVAFRQIQVTGSAVNNVQPLVVEALPYRVISHGEAAGPYQAFPDACRLPNGDILCVFYAGYGHIALPNKDWPKGGRICSVRSSDEGRTWSAPQVLFDGPEDDRDPHIAAMRDGSLVCSFFVFRKLDGKESYDTCIVTSRDGGQKWEPEPRVLARNWAVSAPVREMVDGTRLLGVYAEANKTAFGGVLRSTDSGKTWSEPVPIDPQSGVRLDAETDLIQLKDGAVFAALRGDGKVHMHYSLSKDLGVTWSPVKDIGFLAHSPHLTRLSSGEILLTHRLPNTALHISRDDGQTWQGPTVIDSVIGAYPATVELKDKSVLVVYYQEGSGSAIRAQRFRVTAGGIEKMAWELQN